MKTSKLIVLLTIIAMGTSTLLKAQETEDKTQQINVPESYQETQQQIEPDASEGTSTYNIDENVPEDDSGAASWRSEEDVEVLRVYSGSQDGNNLIRTIEVKRSQDSYDSRAEYVPN